MAHMCFPWLEVPDHVYLKDIVVNNFINVMLSANLNFPDSSNEIRKLFDCFLLDRQASYEVQVEHLRDIVGVAPAAESNEYFPHPDDIPPSPNLASTPAVASPMASKQQLLPSKTMDICTKSSTPCVNTSPSIVPLLTSEQQLPVKSINTCIESSTIRDHPSSAASTVAPPITSEQQFLPSKTMDICTESSTIRDHPSSTAPTVAPPMISEQQQLPAKSINTCTESSTPCVNSSPSISAPTTSRKSRFTGIAAREKLQQQMLNATK